MNNQLCTLYKIEETENRTKKILAIKWETDTTPLSTYQLDDDFEIPVNNCKDGFSLLSQGVSKVAEVTVPTTHSWRDDITKSMFKMQVNSKAYYFLDDALIINYDNASSITYVKMGRKKIIEGLAVDVMSEKQDEEAKVDKPELSILLTQPFLINKRVIKTRS